MPGSLTERCGGRRVGPSCQSALSLDLAGLGGCARSPGAPATGMSVTLPSPPLTTSAALRVGTQLSATCPQQRSQSMI